VQIHPWNFGACSQNTSTKSTTLCVWPSVRDIYSIMQQNFSMHWSRWRRRLLGLLIAIALWQWGIYCSYTLLSILANEYSYIYTPRYNYPSDLYFLHVAYRPPRPALKGYISPKDWGLLFQRDRAENGGLCRPCGSLGKRGSAPLGVYVLVGGSDAGGAQILGRHRRRFSICALSDYFVTDLVCVFFTMPLLQNSSP
jgi:hypothetical protein